MVTYTVKMLSLECHVAFANKRELCDGISATSFPAAHCTGYLSLVIILLFLLSSIVFALDPCFLQSFSPQAAYSSSSH
jgi:hypothetical protein